MLAPAFGEMSSTYISSGWPDLSPNEYSLTIKARQKPRIRVKTFVQLENDGLYSIRLSRFDQH
jgi:hypothetical protein